MENNKQSLDFVKSMIQDIIDNIDNKLVEFLKPLYFNPNLQSWSVPIDGEYLLSFRDQITQTDEYINLKHQCKKRNLNLNLSEDLKYIDDKSKVHSLAPSMDNYYLCFEKLMPEPEYFSLEKFRCYIQNDNIYSVKGECGFRVFNKTEALKIEKNFKYREDEIEDEYRQIMEFEDRWLSKYCHSNKCRLVDIYVLTREEDLEWQHFSAVGTEEVRYLFEKNNKY